MLHVAWSPVYKYSLPAGHRFPMEKYELLPEQLIYEGTLQEDNFFQPSKLRAQTILYTHSQLYWKKLQDQTLTAKECRKIGLPMSKELVSRGRYISGGTLDCARYALQHGVAINTAGGTHHAYADHGEGFCVLNDFAIASNALLKEGLIQQILIIDLDVHQGNGTAHLFKDDLRVFTFSMHGERNYPLRKEASDLDIELPDGMTDGPYLDLLTQHLEPLFQQVEPDLVFYLSGVDILASDKLGRLALSEEGCKKRDELVFACCKRNGVPCAVSMGGGYTESLADLVNAHSNTFRVAQELYF